MLLFFLALAGTIALVLVLRTFAHRLDWVDHPGGRKHHELPTPMVGGLAMFGAVALALLADQAYTGVLAVLIGCGAGMVVLGTVDDRYGLHVRLRLAVQAVIALVVILAADGKVTHVGALFGFGDVSLGALSIPFSVVAYVGGINAINMIDGADGMAGKMGLVTVAGVGVLAYLSGAAQLFPVVLAVSGSLVGFLLFNTRIFVRRAWIFMGDAGSMWLGLVLGWFMAQLTHAPTSVEPALVFWLFGIPVIDTLAVMMRRIRRKTSPFAADRTHIHHVFQNNGHSVRRTVLTLTMVQILLVGTGVAFYAIKAPGYVVFGAFVLLMAAYLYLLQRLHRSPVDVIRAAKGQYLDEALKGE